MTLESTPVFTPSTGRHRNFGEYMAVFEIKADIAGSVWKITKSVGDRISGDESILILESMKMEIPVVSPDPGTVKEIFVKEGDVVSEGTLVARIEA